jgi:hypothetical protein
VVKKQQFLTHVERILLRMAGKLFGIGQSEQSDSSYLQIAFIVFRQGSDSVL